MKAYLLKNSLRTVVMGVLLMSAISVFAQPTCIVGGTNFDTEWELCNPVFTNDNTPTTGSLPETVAGMTSAMINSKVAAIMTSYCPDPSNHFAPVSSAKHLPESILGNVMSTNDGRYPFDAFTRSFWGLLHHQDDNYYAGTTAIVANPRTIHAYLLNRPGDNMLVNVNSTNLFPFYTYTAMGLKPNSDVVFEADFWLLVSDWAVKFYGRSGAYCDYQMGVFNVFNNYNLTATGVTCPTTNANANANPTYTISTNAASITRIRIGTSTDVESAHPRRVIINNGNNYTVPEGSATATRVTFTGKSDANGNITFYVARTTGGSGVANNFNTPIGIDNVVIRGDVQPQIASQKVPPVCQANPVKLYPRQNYPAGTSFEWSVNTDPQESGTSETFAFIPFDKPSYNVSLSVQIPGAGCVKGTSTFTLPTKVCCTKVVDGVTVPLAETYVFYDDFGTFPTNNSYEWKDPDGTVHLVPVAGMWRWGPYNPLPVGQKPTDLLTPGLPKGYWSTAHADPHHNVCAILYHSPYGGQLTDASDTGRGGMMFFGLQGNGFTNAILYQKEVCGLCKGKEITFGAKFAAANSKPSSGNASTRFVGILDLVLREGKGNAGRQLYATGGVTLEGGDGWHSAEHKFTIDTDETCVTLQVVSRGTDNGDGKGDFVIDDIFFSVCTPPDVLINATVANGADPLNLCDNTDMTLKVEASDAITKFYNDVRYLFQYTYDDVTWHDLEGISALDYRVIANPPAHSVFSSLKNGDKVYFRVIVGDADYLTNHRPEWQSMSAFNACRAISISTFRFEAALNCKLCTGPAAISINAAGGTITGTGATRTVNLCQGQSVVLSTNNIGITPAYGNFGIRWYKDTQTGAGVQTNTGVTTSNYTVSYNDVTEAGNTYYVRAYDNAMESSSSCYKWDQIIVKRYPALNAGAIATTGQILCQGDTPLQIGSTTAAGGGNGSITYEWYKDGALVYTGANATYTPPASDIVNTGATQVTINYTRRAKDGACQTTAVNSTGTWTITINPIPAINNINATAVCSGNPFTVAPNIVPTGTSYTWSAPSVAGISGATSGSNAGNISGTLTSTNSTATNVTYIVTPRAGACTGSNFNVTVPVNPAPRAVINNAAGTAICANSTFTLNATATAGAVAWTHNGTGAFNSTTAESPVYTPGAGDAGNTVILTMTVTSNQTPACGTAQATYNLAVRALPAATITTATGGSICAGSAFNLASTVANGTITWTTNGTGAFNGTSAVNPTYTPSAADGANGTVMLTLTVRSNATPACTPDAVATYTLTVTPIQTATISYSGAPFCQNLTATQAVTLNGTGSYSGGSYTSTAGLIIAANGAITPSGSTAGNYTVTYTIPASGGCPAVPVQTQVTIKPKPQITTAPTTICAGSTLQLVASPTTGAVSWGSNPTSTGTVNASGLFTAASVASNANTQITYTVDGCDSDPVTIGVDVIPNAPVTSSRTGCPSPASNMITWLSLVEYQGTLKWYQPENTQVSAPGSFDENVQQTITYWVSQTTGAGCESRKSAVVVDINEAATMPVVNSYSECAALSGGTITWASLVSKSATDKLNWFTADNADPNSTAGATTDPGSFDPKIPAATQTYYVQIEDANECKSRRAAINVTVNPLPDAGITNNTATTVLTCTNPSISLTATGGNSYAWTGELGNSANATVTQAGNYTVTVTDGNLCSSTDNISISINKVDPTVTITNNTNATNMLTCEETSISLTANATGVSFLWSNALGTNANATATAPNTYTVEVTDLVNGCKNEASITINQDVAAPTVSITNNTGETELTCSITSITFTAGGGVSYSWNEGLAETANLTVTTPGKYTVTATDAKGCTAIGEIIITQNNTPPTANILNNTGETELTCSVTEISLTAEDGVSYSWDNDLGTNANLTVSNPGRYTVTVKGANDCTNTTFVDITQSNEMPAPVITPSTATITCSTPSITLVASATGGDGDYTFSWGENAEITVTTPNEYTVTVTDGNGCSKSATATITRDIELPTVTITNNTEKTELTCDVTEISLTATGGGSYSWNNGLSASANLTVTTPDTYTVTVTGDNGCTSKKSITIDTNGSIPTIFINTNPATTVLTCTTTSITLTAAGGVSYVWNDGSQTNSISVDKAGTYSVTGISGNGCSNAANITITSEKTSPAIFVDNPAICEGDNATITASGAADSYTWSTGETGANITVAPTATTTYTVTGKVTTTGCTNTATATVYVEMPLILTLVKPTSVNLGEEITLTVNAEGPAHGYYSWFVNNAQFMTTAENSITFRPEAGRQQFRVETATTDLGCFAASESSIVNVEEIVMNAINPYNPNGRNCCFMKSDGTNPGYQVEIYNRYMQKVFEGDDGWDGTYRGAIADPGTYFYRLHKKDGSIEKGTLEVIKF